MSDGKIRNPCLFGDGHDPAGDERNALEAENTRLRAENEKLESGLEVANEIISETLAGSELTETRLRAELAVVKRELVECCDAMNADQTELFVERRKATEALAAARKDGERLDWLDQSWVSVEKFPNWKWMSNRTDVHPMLKRTLSPHSLRAAIDAAMEGEG